MIDFLLDVVRTIEHPDHREPDARVGRERLFKRGGPDRWICVVLEFAGDYDRVITAFSRFSDPGPIGRR
jgi:hypothetical protein